MVLRKDASLGRAVELIVEHGVAFCTTSAGLGIISAADLNKPLCTLWILGRILEFEDALTNLFSSITSRAWKASQTESWIDALNTQIERRKADGTYLTDEDCLTLAHKLNICRDWLRNTFVNEGKKRMSVKQFRSDFGWLAGVRNDLAHGRPPRQGSGAPQELLQKLERLDEYTSRLLELVSDREEIWDHYAGTQISIMNEGTMTLIENILEELPERFWIVSAMNPFERLLPDEVNSSRHEALCSEAKRRGIYICDGLRSSPQNGEWTDSIVLLGGNSRKHPMELSHWYGQRSALEIEGKRISVVEVKTGEIRRSTSLTSPDTLVPENRTMSTEARVQIHPAIDKKAD